MEIVYTAVSSLQIVDRVSTWGVFGWVDVVGWKGWVITISNPTLDKVE